MFATRMMPGEAPYTEAELETLHELVDDAALGDPGEGPDEDELRTRHLEDEALLEAERYERAVAARIDALVIERRLRRYVG